MTKPDNRKGVAIAGVPWLLHTDRKPRQVKKPLKVTGNFVPATFRVDGFDCELTFTLGLVKKSARNRKSDAIQITQGTFNSQNGFTATDIPVGLLRSLGVKASTFLAYLIPPHYTWIDHGVINKAGKEGNVYIIDERGIPPPLLDRDLHGIDLYEVIGRIWREAPYGEKHSRVADAFDYSTKWANKHIMIGKQEYPQFFKQRKDKK